VGDGVGVKGSCELILVGGCIVVVTVSAAWGFWEWLGEKIFGVLSVDFAVSV